MTHDCPGGCGRAVPYNHLSCRTCWYRLPHDLRSAVVATWRTHDHDPAAHRAAMADACRWYRENQRAGC